MLAQQDISESQRYTASWWIRTNSIHEINSHTIPLLSHSAKPNVIKRINNLLITLGAKTEFIGESISFTWNDLYWQGATCSINNEELYEFCSYLTELGLVENDNTLDGHISLKITSSGWNKIDELSSAGANSSQGFVAMWFNDELTPIYFDVIAPAIEQAGYKPHRVDQREHNGKVDDEIIAQIRRSRFVVADFTGQRGGVYYEAGFAKGLNLEVFWTCRKDHLKDWHFDIRQHNCIVWEPDKLDEFKSRLANRIEAVLGRGPNAAL